MQGRTLVFTRSLAQEGKLGALRWTSMFLGVAGTYRKHDTVDVVYERDGRRVVATGLRRKRASNNLLLALRGRSPSRLRSLVTTCYLEESARTSFAPLTVSRASGRPRARTRSRATRRGRGRGATSHAGQLRPAPRAR